MKVVFSDIRVPEEILVSRLDSYFDEIGWNDRYKKFPIRINNEFPWVPYMRNVMADKGTLDFNKIINGQTSLFPSLTVVNDSDEKAITVFLRQSTTKLVPEDMEDFKKLFDDNSGGQFISPLGLLAIEDAVEKNGVVYGSRIVYKKTEIIKIDVTVDDESNIKNRLFDLVEQFLVGQGNLDMINNDKIEVKTQTIRGNRSGVYNIEFGRVLRGGTISFEVDYEIIQVYYDTDLGVIESVDITHKVEVPNGESS